MDCIEITEKTKNKKWVSKIKKGVKQKKEKKKLPSSKMGIKQKKEKALSPGKKKLDNSQMSSFLPSLFKRSVCRCHRRASCIMRRSCASCFGRRLSVSRDIGIDVRTDCMRVTLPPKDRCFCFHLANFLSHLLIRGSHI